MKKRILLVIDILIFLLSFLSILSSFFKIISITEIVYLVYNNTKVLLVVWSIGIALAIILTHPLYQWILHLRQPLQKPKKLHHQ